MKMSLLNQIIDSARKMDIKNIDENITKLAASVQDVKLNFEEFIQGTCLEYTRKMHKNIHLTKKVDDLKEKLQTLNESMQNNKLVQVKTCSIDVEKHSATLFELNTQIEHITRVNNIFNLINDSINLKKEKKYNEAITEINKALQIIDSIPPDEQMNSIQTLHNELLDQMHLLVYELNSIFENNVKCSIDGNTSEIKIKEFNGEMAETCMALYTNDKNNFIPLDKVAFFFYEHIFVPVITKTTNVQTLLNENKLLLKVNIVKCEPLEYEKIFAHVSTICKFVKTNLDYKLQDDVYIINYFGDKLADKISELIINECLEKTIPETVEELDKYESIAENIKDFQSFLIEYGIFTKGAKSLTEFTDNIKVLFINRKCEAYLSNSRSIMKKDLHDYLEVGLPHDPNNLLQSTEFSQCTISKSSKELITLVNKIVEIAFQFPDIYCSRFINTIDNIFSLYVQLVPEYHDKLLKTIPQQVALFHNNSLYLSYELLHLQEQYGDKDDVDFTKTIENIKNIGTSMFTSCVEQHKQQNDKIMLDCGLSGIETLEKVDAKLEKCVRQCLRQQELLKTVWHKILSYTDYNQSIGYILNGLCTFFINKIINLVDISSEAAEQLVDVMKIIQTRGLKLFTDPKEIHLYVSSWYKFNELGFVLNASLADINDRWADGKGPLALQFDVIEMRNLICALFQNTDIRANLLTKIK